MKRRRWLRIAAIAIGGFAGVYLIAGITAWWASYRTARQAAHFLDSLRSIRVERTTRQEVLKLAGKYPSAKLGPCEEEACVIDFRFDNMWLSRLRLAPLTVFSAHITCGGTRVNYLSSALITASYWQPNVGTEVHPIVVDPDYKVRLFSAYEIRLFRAPDPGNRALRAFAVLSADATDEQFNAAFDFNLKCLYRIGGCRDAEQLAPRWWSEH